MDVELADTRLQYLYLLFDEDNPINIGVTNSVFTTEGHLLSLDKILLKPAPKSRKGEALYCPRYDPLATVNASLTAGALQTGIPHRRDMEYARALTGLQPNVILAQQSGLWHPNGYCEAPLVEVGFINIHYYIGNLPSLFTL